MNLHFQLIAIYSSILSVGLAAQAGSAANPKTPVALVPIGSEKVIVLNQRHRWLGRVIVYCNNSHLKVVTLESEAALVSNAPEWKVQIYDPQRKLIYEVTKDVFLDSGFTGPFQDSGLILSPISRVGRGRLGRIPAILYSFSRPSNNVKATYWILNSRSVTGTVCQMLQALYEAPSAPGLPLAIESGRDAKAKGSENLLVFAEAGGPELTTAKCEIGTIPTSSFNYLHGYKKARFATDVLVNKKIKRDMEDGLTEFGLGLPKTK
jgi:hypothetical protein